MTLVLARQPILGLQRLASEKDGGLFSAKGLGH